MFGTRKMRGHRTADKWVREFNVLKPHKDPSKGHTVYEVTSVLYPEGFPEVSTTLKVTKRFSEFQKLHRTLNHLHKGLYLKGAFPSLPKSKYFKRFDPEVIEERRASFLEALKFIGQHPPLFNSPVFTDFFAQQDESCQDQSEGGEDALKHEGSREKSPLKESVISMQKSGNVMDASLLSVQLGCDQTPTMRPATPVSPEEEMKNLPDYLSEAAEDVSLAIQNELDENYEESVDCYRNAIETLLSSVQQDKCLKRQASVKRRIAQYINKAEDLMQKKNDKKRVFKSLNRESKIPHLDLFGDMSDLRKYKVIGVISQKVILAKDFRNDEEVVVKVLLKSPEVRRASKRSILPINVAFMVNLLCYYETDVSLFLVLERVKHGQLYDAVSNVFRRNFEKQESSEFNHQPTSCGVVIKRPQSFGEAVERDSSFDDLNIVYQDQKTDNLLCFGSGTVEKIDLACADEEFDFMKDCVDEEAEEVLETLDLNEELEEEEKDGGIVGDSKCLLNKISAKLSQDDSGQKVDEILEELEKIEDEIYSQLDRSRRRSYTPGGVISPFIQPGQKTQTSSSQTASSPKPDQKFDRELRNVKVFEKYNFKPMEPIPICLFKHWASQLFHVLFNLHARGVIVRDLNPSNLLLDSSGDLKVTFQYEWVSVERDINRSAEECFYTAPEVCDVIPLTKACDYWSVGVILYELVTGFAFVDVYPSGLRPHVPLEFHVPVDSDLMSLLSSLVHPVSGLRMSSQAEVENHPFFVDVEWNK